LRTIAEQAVDDRQTAAYLVGESGREFLATSHILASIDRRCGRVWRRFRHEREKRIALMRIQLGNLPRGSRANPIRPLVNVRVRWRLLIKPTARQNDPVSPRDAKLLPLILPKDATAEPEIGIRGRDDGYCRRCPQVYSVVIKVARLRPRLLFNAVPNNRVSGTGFKVDV
jgi:hypothetical protein